MGCGQLKEVQISPRVKYVEGRKVTPEFSQGPGGGVAAFYVDGKLAALGWQEIWNYDSPNIGASALNQISKIGVGVGAPRELLALARGDYGLDTGLGGKTFNVKNAVFRSANAGDRRGILLIDRSYYQIVSNAIGRDDRKTAQWLLQDFLKKYGLKAFKIGTYEYRIPYSEGILEKAEQYFVGSKKLENHACCGHPGSLFTFQGLSSTNIDFLPDYREDYRNKPKSVTIIIKNGWNN